MSDVGDSTGRRVWFLSPALATLLFFGAQVVLAFWGQRSTPRVAGLAPQAPIAPVDTRVVQSIRAAEPVSVRDSAEVLQALQAHQAVRLEAAPLPRVP